ncbi:hypothetical protein PV326_011954 [Microctonus aethiopoides]|nr:hypothetical protein PV326_011954 [Microctonus aethiopoides]
MIKPNVGLSGSTDTTNNKMIEALVACEPDILQVFSVTSHTLDDEQRVLGQISDIYNRELVGIIGWAKQILGFSSLALNDQMRLLQSTWVKIILTFSLAWKSMPHTGRYRFTQDITLDERLARESHCTDLYTHCIQIVDRVEKLGSSTEEFYYLKALILTNSDIRLDIPQA